LEKTISPLTTQLSAIVICAAFLGSVYTMRKRTVPFGARLRVLLIVNGLCTFGFICSQWGAFNPSTFALFAVVQTGVSLALYRADAKRPW